MSLRISQWLRDKYPSWPSWLRSVAGRWVGLVKGKPSHKPKPRWRPVLDQLEEISSPTSLLGALGGMAAVGTMVAPAEQREASERLEIASSGGRHSYSSLPEVASKTPAWTWGRAPAREEPAPSRARRAEANDYSPPLVQSLVVNLEAASGRYHGGSGGGSSWGGGAANQAPMGGGGPVGGGYVGSGGGGGGLCGGSGGTGSSPDYGAGAPAQGDGEVQGDGGAMAAAMSAMARGHVRIATTTTLAILSLPEHPGDSAVLQATVSADRHWHGPVPGRVSFWEGEALLGTTRLRQGVATFETPPLSAGRHFITAVYHGLGPFAPSVSNTVDADPEPTISIDDVGQSETDSGTTAFTFTVTLSDPSNQTVTVDFMTQDNTASTMDSDYSYASGTVTFDPYDPSFA